MKHKSEILIKAPLNLIFITASDVTRWPEFLPHYRYNRFLSHHPSGGMVKTSCSRWGVVINWTSDFWINTARRQLSFHHHQSTLNISQGMKVEWNFREISPGVVRVMISHDLPDRPPTWNKTVNDWLLGEFFLHKNSELTLAGLKRKVEPKAPLPIISLPAAPKLTLGLRTAHSAKRLS